MRQWQVRLTGGLVLAAILMALPFYSRDPYILHMVNMVALWVILTTSLSLVINYTGMISFAHVAFYMLGAYASALLTIHTGAPLWVAAPFGTVLGAGLGFLIAIPSVRFEGKFLAVVTLAFFKLLYLLAYHWTGLTNGPDGFRVPGLTEWRVAGTVLGSRAIYFYILVPASLLSVWVLLRLIQSRVGRIFEAIRENESLAAALRIDTHRYKVLSFTIASAFAAFAGTLYASYYQFITPYSFTVHHAIDMLLIVALGGTSLVGTIIATVVLVVLPELLRFLQDYRMIVYGGLLVVIIVYRPALTRRWRRVLRRTAAVAGGD